MGEKKLVKLYFVIINTSISTLFTLFYYGGSPAAGLWGVYLAMEGPVCDRRQRRSTDAPRY